MRSLWRRFVAWWNTDDTAEMLLWSMHRECGDAMSSKQFEGYIQTLRNIGSSPRSIELAESVLADLRAKEQSA